MQKRMSALINVMLQTKKYLFKYSNPQNNPAFYDQIKI